MGANKYILEGLYDTWDKTTTNNIDKLHPEIRSSAFRFITLCLVNKMSVRIYCSLRTFSEQDSLYAKGRTTEGKIITKAKGGQSYHNYGLAFDCVQINEGKALWSNVNWGLIGRLGKDCGFEWGGDWKFKDKPHFQMTFDKTTKELLSLYNDKKFIKGGEFLQI